jgi:8-amino-7-oxononanoate synthase/dethiobiotin synthetase
VRCGEPGDLAEVRRLSGVTDLHELVRYDEPLAPGIAAVRAGDAGLTADGVADAVRALSDRSLVLVEGAGGLLVRLGSDGTTLADVAANLDAAVLVVVRAGLGTLNHAALTCEALDRRGLRCRGLVVGAWPAEPDLAASLNLHALSEYTGRPVLGRIPENAGRLARAAFAAGAQVWITTEEPL